MCAWERDASIHAGPREPRTERFLLASPIALQRLGGFQVALRVVPRCGGLQQQWSAPHPMCRIASWGLGFKVVGPPTSHFAQRLSAHSGSSSVAASATVGGPMPRSVTPSRVTSGFLNRRTASQGRHSSRPPLSVPDRRAHELFPAFLAAIPGTELGGLTRRCSGLASLAAELHIVRRTKR